jgi:hypothetical protein
MKYTANEILANLGLKTCSPNMAFEITNPHVWNYNNVELNEHCFFSNPHKRTRTNLTNTKLLHSISEDQFCACWEFAWIISLPDYENTELTEEEFISLAVNSGAIRFVNVSKVTYRLENPSIHYQDPFIKEVLQNYYPSIYKELKEYTKTPFPGRMYYSLLKYCLPLIRRVKNKTFDECYEETLQEIEANFDHCEPLSIEQALFEMPKATSGGFTSIALCNARLKKGEMIPEIMYQYNKNKSEDMTRIYRHNIYAMRGHLSKRSKNKTRYIWVVPPETILSEIRFAKPFYDQLKSNPFFNERILTGKGTLPALRRFISNDCRLRYINTDISGWDAMGCKFVQRDLFNIYRRKLYLNGEDSKEFNYVMNNNINTTMCLPSGIVLQKSAGVTTGTYFTLINNSILNMVFCRTVLRMMKCIDFCVDQKWLGDDFAFYSELNDFDLLKFSNLLAKYFGLKINVDKSIDTYDPNERKFIGYQIKDGELFRPELEFFAGSLFGEQFIDQKKMGVEISLGKIFSFLLIGGSNHREFYDFFFCFVGYWKETLQNIEFIWKENQLPGLLRVLKVAWAIELPALNLDSYKNFNYNGIRNFLLYDGCIQLLNMF